MKKFFALVVALSLLASFGSTLAQAEGSTQNRYNFVETEGITKVNLNCNEYWIWTVPEKVTIDFTKRNPADAQPFGYVSVENIVLDDKANTGEKYADKVITISTKEIKDLKLTGLYTVYSKTSGDTTEYKNAAAEGFELSFVREAAKSAAKDAEKAYFKAVEDAIPARTAGSYDGWKLVVARYSLNKTAASNLEQAKEKEDAAAVLENGNDDDKVQAAGKRAEADTLKGYVYDNSNGYLKSGTVGATKALVEGSEIILAVRTDVAHAKVFKLDAVDKSDVTAYKAGERNKVSLTVPKDGESKDIVSAIPNSIQGMNGAVKTDLSYVCWGSPKYIGTYEGSVTYTMASSEIAPITAVGASFN